MDKISFRELKTTKTNLINLTKRLNFAERGENFLKYKREQLLLQIENNQIKYQNQRKIFLDLFKNALLKLNKTYREMGKQNLYFISKVSKLNYTPTINVVYTKRIGMLLSNINYNLQELPLPVYSFQDTSHHLDELIVLIKSGLKNMILLAEKEDLMLKLALNYKKVSRRINGLKYNIIPRLKLDIKKIKETLEENDRDNFVRLKKTKELINKKKGVV